jgi:hypothetical protein
LPGRRRRFTAVRTRRLPLATQRRASGQAERWLRGKRGSEVIRAERVAPRSARYRRDTGEAAEDARAGTRQWSPSSPCSWCRRVLRPRHWTFRARHLDVRFPASSGTRPSSRDGRCRGPRSKRAGLRRLREAQCGRRRRCRDGITVQATSASGCRRGTSGSKRSSIERLRACSQRASSTRSGTFRSLQSWHRSDAVCRRGSGNSPPQARQMSPPRLDIESLLDAGVNMRRKMTDTWLAGIEDSRNLNRRVAEISIFPLAPKGRASRH